MSAVNFFWHEKSDGIFSGLVRGAFGGLQLSRAQRGLDHSGLIQVSNSDVKDSAVCVCVIRTIRKDIYTHLAR